MTQNALQNFQGEFLKDLQESFGEQCDKFTEDLKTLLFELWVRARTKKITEPRQEPSFESLLTKAIQTSHGVREAFIELTQQVIHVGPSLTKDYDLDGITLHLNSAPSEVTKKLLDQSDLSIPKLSDVNETNQERLYEYLLHFGVCTDEPNWHPVFQHAATGSQIALKGHHHYVMEEKVSTNLVYDYGKWRIPNPKPLNHFPLSISSCQSPNTQNSHIKVFLNEVLVAPKELRWETSQTDPDYVDAVYIKGSKHYHVVVAEYSVMKTHRGML